MRAIATVLVAVSFLTSGCAPRSGAPLSPASLVRDDWTAVTQVHTGSAVRVTSRANVSLEGRLVAADVSHIAVRTRSGEIRLARTEVQTVWAERRQTKRGAKIGFGAGAIAGIAAGLVATRSNRLPWALMLGAGWGGIGALIGALEAPHGSVVIYTAGGVP